MTEQTDIKIEISKGFSKSGRTVFFVRPLAECFNRSWRCDGRSQLDRCIRMRFFPKVILYEIEGRTIGSNNKANAIMEFWRVCDIEDIGQQFEIKQL